MEQRTLDLSMPPFDIEPPPPLPLPVDPLAPRLNLGSELRQRMSGLLALRLSERMRLKLKRWPTQGEAATGLMLLIDDPFNSLPR